MTMAITEDACRRDSNTHTNINNNKRKLSPAAAHPPHPPPGSTVLAMAKTEVPWKWEPASDNPTATYTEGAKGSDCVSCSVCGESISDRYILQVAGKSSHASCLRCSICRAMLDSHSSCFLRDEQFYCKFDYAKIFGTKCFKCCALINPTDWVRKASDQVYHLACFACDACKRQLSTGEEFGIHENRVLCKAHYMEMLDGGGSSSDENPESESNSKKKTKRMRTTFTEEQIQILQANFQIDSNPDGQDLERIAQITGLSKRVTQVWFQNCRARQKKYMNTGKSRNAAQRGSNGGGVSPGGGRECATPQQLDLHVMYSTFRAQLPAASSDSNSEDLSQDSASGFMRGEV